MKSISTLRLQTMTRKRLIAVVRVLERDLTTKEEDAKILERTLRRIYEEALRG